MTMDRRKTTTESGTPSASSPNPPPARPPAVPANAAESAPRDAKAELSDSPAPKVSRQKRWQETRGRLQEALAEWEKSEQRAVEMLKEAEDERAHLEDLLLKLKAKLQELS